MPAVQELQNAEATLLKGVIYQFRATYSGAQATALIAKVVPTYVRISSSKLVWTQDIF